MGGWGSGRQSSSGSKTTTESQHRIDIRYMKKTRLLIPGTVGTLSWNRGGNQTGFINFQMEEDALILNYRFRFRGGEWEEVEEVVSFERTACNYGGQRTWLLCPRCYRRVILLYGAGKRFLCRHCHNLTHATQKESIGDRLTRKTRNIRRRLGGGMGLLEPFPEKPKGMHWETYRRLAYQAETANQIAFAMLLDHIF